MRVDVFAVGVIYNCMGDDMNLTKQQITDIAKSIGLGYAEFKAFIDVESGGSGFINGKIVIQFEPLWFRRLTKKIPDNSPLWQKVLTNKVEGQASEWLAFNAAFKLDKRAAMMSTSIGLMQIMGFHYDTLGFDTVDEMWDSFKGSEYNQVMGGAKFIKSNKPLYTALKDRVWSKVAYYYNGSNYRVNKYDTKLKAAYEKALVN